MICLKVSLLVCRRKQQSGAKQISMQQTTLGHLAFKTGTADTLRRFSITEGSSKPTRQLTPNIDPVLDMVAQAIAEVLGFRSIILLANRGTIENKMFTAIAVAIIGRHPQQ